MAINTNNFRSILEECNADDVQLVAVSKTKPVEDILALYQDGQLDFGENYVQELVEKQPQLPAEIRWHFIGHLQTNKVKYIAPFVYIIHGVESFKLLKEINKQAQKHNRVINVLLQIHISQEETKFGLDETELEALLHNGELSQLNHIQIKGLMGMASFSDDESLVRTEFKSLKNLFDKLGQYEITNLQPEILSMGMSDDFRLAIEEGSTMVRIGSLIFGAR